MTKIVFSAALGWFALEAGRLGLKRLSMGLASERDARAILEHDLEIVNLDFEKLDRAAPAWLQSAIKSLRDYADGKNVDPTTLPVEPTTTTEFQRRVIQVCRKIPRGATATYGEVAKKAGSPGAARAVGRVMATNRIPLAIPCHRVVGTQGLHGFSAPGGLATKRRLLELEGAVSATDT